MVSINTMGEYGAFLFLAVGNVICYIIRFSINIAVLDMTDLEPTYLEGRGEQLNNFFTEKIRMMKKTFNRKKL